MARVLPTVRHRSSASSPLGRWSIVVALGLILSGAAASGADPDPSPPAPATASPPTAGAANDKLMPGDLLHIEVYDNPDLTTDVRVPIEDAVQFPLVGQVDGLRGMTCEGLARHLGELLEAKFLNRASVTVTVKEYGARRAFVMGGVAHPGAITLSPTLSATAIRAISEAGGLLDDADRRNIVVLRENGQGGIAILAVTVAVAGGESADVTLGPNDLIMVPRLDRVYVTGQVKQPGSVLCNQPNLTVARALSLVGGFDKYARGSEVQLLRAGKTVRVVDVDAILAGHGEDLPLLPGDMLNVPERRY